jgi:NADH-quinone oxidoreductase subunit E
MTEQQLITPESLQEIDRWISKYPAEQRQSAVMAALRIVQDQNGGHLTTELMDAVADHLEMPKIAVYEVATFYSMYEHKPVGKHKLCVCTNISCLLNGSDEIVDALKKKIGVSNFGEISADGKFSLKEVECLGACCNAPAMQVGHKYHEDLTPESVVQLVDSME